MQEIYYLWMKKLTEHIYKTLPQDAASSSTDE